MSARVCIRRLNKSMNTNKSMGMICISWRFLVRIECVKTYVCVFSFIPLLCFEGNGDATTCYLGFWFSCSNAAEG